MPRARRNRDRLKQVANWLRASYPTPYPVELYIGKLSLPNRPIEHGGDCTRVHKGRRRYLLVRIEERLPRGDAIFYLLHEWAHAHTWACDAIEKTRAMHPDEFWLALGRMYRDLYDVEDDEDPTVDFPW